MTDEQARTERRAKREIGAAVAIAGPRGVFETERLPHALDQRAAAARSSVRGRPRLSKVGHARLRKAL